MRTIQLEKYLLIIPIIVTSLFSMPTTLTAATIELNKAVHFLTPGGEDVVVEPGTYQLEQAEGWIRLFPDERRNAVLLYAEPDTHEDTLIEPEAMFVSGDGDEPYLVLQLPDGQALIADGSFSGVRARGLFNRKPRRRPRPQPVSSSPHVPSGWQRVYGTAKDMSVGPNGGIWIIGTNTTKDGYGVYRRDQQQWRPVSGAEGLRIDVGPNSTPWIVTKSGKIFTKTGDQITQIKGTAKDIGVGAEGSVWIIGTKKVSGGFAIYRRQKENWQEVGGAGGLEIDVDPKGNPWIVNGQGNIFRRADNQWTRMPGRAKAISIGADGSVWIIGTDRQPEGYGVYRWNGKQWIKITGWGVRIAVKPSGVPGVVTNRGNIYRKEEVASQAKATGTQPDTPSMAMKELPAEPSKAADQVQSVRPAIGQTTTEPKIIHADQLTMTGLRVPTGPKVINAPPLTMTGLRVPTGPKVINAPSLTMTGLRPIPHGPKVINAPPLTMTGRRTEQLQVSTPWKQIPGGARDIAIGGDGSVWIVGTTKQPGGYRIYKWDGRGWVERKAPGAERIDVDKGGNPYIINATKILRWRFNGWGGLPGTAQDISVGTGVIDSVFITRADQTIHQLLFNKWVAKPGATAARIDLGPEGLPWVVNDQGHIYEAVGAVYSFTWQRRPGLAKDIAVGGNGAVWIVGAHGGVHTWEKATGKWKKEDLGSLDGSITNIAVSPRGQPWVVTNKHTIYQRPSSP